MNDTTLDNTRRQRSFLIPLFLVYEEKGIWEKRVSATFVDSTASESVSRAKVHIVSACLSPSSERERERKGEEEEGEGKEISEENREKKRTDERKGGGSDEARVNRVQKS